MNLARLILKTAGWKVDISVPDYPKCIFCVAPHTSNWDFILGELAIRSVGRKAGFLMKEQWFFWPLGCLFRAIGGIPVPKKHGAALSEQIVEMFKTRQRMCLAITPEGTRSPTARWRRGFLFIARDAKVPILLGAIDYRRRSLEVTHEFTPTGDIDADMRAIKQFYSIYTAKYPEKFITDDEQPS